MMTCVQSDMNLGFDVTKQREEKPKRRERDTASGEKGLGDGVEYA